MVMDFPDNVVTNLYEVTGVHEIYWNLYRKGDVATTFTGNGDEDPFDLTQFSWVRAEHQLRRQGKHTLLNVDAGEIWIFRLSMAETENLATLMQSIGFHEISCGSLRIADIALPDLAKSDLQSSDRRADLNAAAFQVNRTMTSNVAAREVQSAEGMLDKMRIYRKITTAIALSLTHSLSKVNDWTYYYGPLCIHESSLGDHLLQNTMPNSYLMKTKIGFFDVQWRSTGRLVISTDSQMIPRLCRMSYMIMERSENVRIGALVSLAPFGIKGVFNGIYDSAVNRPLSDTVVEYQSLMADILESFDYSLPQNAQWTQILVHSAASPNTSTSLFLWPADLVFCEDSLEFDFLDAKATLPLDDPLVDPLAWAQAWYLGRHERAKAIKDQQQREDLEVKKTKAQKGSDDVEEMSASETVSPLNHYINPQDVSGVYPTPPDGFPSQANDSSANDEVQITPQALETNASESIDGVHHDLQDNDNHDLFGDVDMDMFASNGVTDADFSFFDEPDTDGEAQTVVERETPPSTTETNDTMDVRLTAERSNEVGTLEEGRDSQPVEEIIEEPPPGASVPSSFEDVDHEKVLDVEEARQSAGANDSPLSQVTSPESSVPSEESSFDRKYAIRGRYGFTTEDLPLSNPVGKHRHSEAALPTIGFHDDDTSSTSDKEDNDEEDRMSTCSQRFRKLDRIEPQTHKTSKRNRNDAGGLDHPATPMSPTSQMSDSKDLLNEHLTRPTSAIFNAMAGLHALNLDLASIDDPDVAYISTERSLIQVAQLVADQIISSTRLLRASGTNTYTGLQIDLPSVDWVEYHADTMQLAVSGLFPSSEPCTTDQYANVDKDDCLKLFTPQITIQRMGKAMDMLASALPFWEQLSLNPFSGSKDVFTCAIYPSRTYLRPAVSNFLEMMRAAYQGCNLGTHHIGISEGFISNGLIPVDTTGKDPAGYEQDLHAFCESLGIDLAKNIRGDSGNIIIYLFNPFNTEDFLPSLCAAFLKLFEAYRSALAESNLHASSDLVLQIIPLDFIFSTERLVIPALKDYRQLSLEVYDRCSPSLREGSDQKRFPFMGAPAVRLAKTIPRNIEFKLNSDPSSASLYNDHRIHVAYSWTPGDLWLTASWTDNQGVLQWNAPYWLGIDDANPTQPFILAAKELWEVTKMMLRPLNSTWRVFVVKDGSLTLEEIKAWQSIITENEKTAITFTILTISSDPSLSFPQQPPVFQKPDDGPAALLATPESTPLASALSPEMTTSTPGAAAQATTPAPNTVLPEQNPDARLIDKLDETWMVVLDRSVDDPYISSPFAKAVASGFLLKRAGIRDGDGLLPVEVSIVLGKEPYHELLKEVLGLYRDLAALARARGVVDGKRGVLPIHVAAAGKARDVISRTMRYDGE